MRPYRFLLGLLRKEADVIDDVINELNAEIERSLQMPRGLRKLEGETSVGVVFGERRREGVEVEAGGADGEVAQPSEIEDLYR